MEPVGFGENTHTIREVLSCQAARNPETPALLAPGRRPMSYGRLWSLTAETVSTLNAAGIGRASRVALVTPNGPEAAAAFCAIASGAACAPLNPAYGQRELEFFLGDLQASALVVAEGMESPVAGVAESLGIPVFPLARAESGEAGAFSLRGADSSAAERPEFGRSDDVALMLHTSGTTSRPKLVPLRNANLISSAHNVRRTLALTASDRCLNVMPLFHIHGLVAAVLASMAAGASVVCTPGFHAASFFAWLAEYQPSWYTAVPTMHQAILAHAESQRIEQPPARLRFLRSSSASLPPSVMTALEQMFSAPVIEAYGMTEAAHQMASNPLPPGVRKPGSVGFAAGPQVRVMDEAGRMLPAGDRGEVVIRGDNVMSGYEANPDANRGAFTGGWFRTGDQGYLDAEGYLFLTGRLKEIINRGGEKISPREIDEVLLEHLAVRQAVTFAVPHAQLGEDIGAAVVAKDNETLTERQVREFAASRLAAFKVPAIVRIVDQIPKGPTGKLRRIGLAEELGIGPSGATPPKDAAEDAGPRTSLETKLLAVWRDVLGVEKIGVHDEFQAVGGTSLVVAELIARAKQDTGMDVSLLNFFEAPTIAGMAERMAPPNPDGQIDGLVAIQPDGLRRPLFCLAGHDENLSGFVSLVPHLGRDQPLLGLGPLADGRGETTVEAIAARRARVMRARQPEGPYALIGLCFGGKVAYEIACILAAQGEQVELLVMIDAFHEAYFRELPRGVRLREAWLNTGRRIRFHFRNFARRKPREWGVYFRQRLFGLADGPLTRIGHRIWGPPGDKGPGLLTSARSRNRFASDHWRPRPYSGNALLIRDATVRAGIYPSPMMGWENSLPPDTSVLEIPSDEPVFWVDEKIGPAAEAITLHLARVRAAHETPATGR